MHASSKRHSVLLSAILTLVATAPVLAGFAGTDVFLPMAGRNVGEHPSNWYTTVWIHNPGTGAVIATVYFLARTTANPSPPGADVFVGPGATEKIENVVESLFHVQAFGALRVTCPDQKLVVTSRLYSKALGGDEKDSVGQDFAGVPAAFAIGLGVKSQVLGVHQTLPTAESDFRYNFGFVETTGHTATVRVRALDDTGVERGVKDFPIREFSQRQAAFKDHFPTLSTDNMRLEVEVISGSGRVIAYGSGVANGSQDPTTFEMTYDDALLGAAAVQHDDTLVGSGNRDVYSDSNGKFTISTSDGRLKKDVLDLASQVDVLAALARLRGVTFSWDTSAERAQGLGDQREIGMIAQEVEAVLPELVGAGAGGYKSLDYAKLTAFLIEVTKAQQERITKLEQRLAALERAGR